MNDIPDKAREIIDILELVPLPQEGGFFRETMRSLKLSKHGEEEKQLYTTIYYLLTSSIVSPPHRVASDEIWHFYTGDPVCLRIFDSTVCDIILGDDLANGQRPQALVEAGKIQAAFPVERREGFSLLATTVVPAFTYDDFKLVSVEELGERFDENFLVPFNK